MYIKINDLNMYYYDSGQSDKQALVFIHGLGENLDSWKSQLDCFSSGYRVIAMDLRGHHRTNDGDKAITIDQFAQDVITLLDTLAIEKAHFIGLSMGGLICQQLAVDYASRIYTLVLCNSACYYSKAARENLSAYSDMVRAVTMDEMAMLITRRCLPDQYNQRVYDLAFNIFRLNRKEPYIAAMIATFTFDFRTKLNKILVPVLIFTGSEDKATPPTASKLIHNLIPHSELHIIQGVGHLSKLENPIAFNQLITNFLACNI
jgi:3-oxoadipate enol-lactonase